MNWSIFCVFLGVYLGLFLGVDLLQRFVIKGTQWSRKATHVLSGVPSCLLPVYLVRNEIILLALVFTVVLGISKYKRILSLHEVERKTLGEIFYPLSIAVIALISLPGNIPAFQVSVLILALSDGFAGIIGERWPVRVFQIRNDKKSLGGTLVFFILSCLILFVVHGGASVLIVPILCMAVALTLTEFVLIYGFDNLILPVMTSLLELYLFG